MKECKADILNRLDARNKAVLLYSVSTSFSGSDLDRIYGELESRFPEIFFMRYFMDPVTQKTGPTPTGECSVPWRCSTES